MQWINVEFQCLLLLCRLAYLIFSVSSFFCFSFQFISFLYYYFIPYPIPRRTNHLKAYAIWEISLPKFLDLCTYCSLYRSSHLYYWILQIFNIIDNAKEEVENPKLRWVGSKLIAMAWSTYWENP